MEKNMFIFVLLISVAERSCFGDLLDKSRIERTHQAGLIFEKMPNIAFSEGSWSLSIILDLSIESTHIASIEREFSKLRRECGEIINCNTFNDQFDILTTKFEEIYLHLYSIKTLGNATNTVSSHTMNHYRLKNQLLDTYTKQIIVGEKNIFLESSLSKNLKLHSNNRSSYKNINDLQKFKKNLTLPEEAQYRAGVRLAILRMSEQLDLMMSDMEQIQSNLLAVKLNQLSNGLLSTGDFKEVVRQHKAYFPACSLLSGEINNINDLNGWVEISSGTDKDLALIEIRIPCIIERAAELYEIKRMPVLQNITRAGGIAYIIPETRYLLKKGAEYYKMPQNELEYCRQGPKMIICPEPWFVFTKEPSCEGSLLLNPTTTDFRLCNIQFEQTQKPIFFKLNSINSWFFLTNQTMDLRVACKNKEYNTELSGMGILRFKPECLVTTSGVKLRVNEPKGNEKYRVTLAEKYLDLRTLSDIFEENEVSSIFEDIVNIKKIKNFWELEKETNKKMRDRNLYMINIICGSILTCATIIAFVLITCILSFMPYSKKVVNKDSEEPTYVKFDNEIELV